jgi:hypothetical protein
VRCPNNYWFNNPRKTWSAYYGAAKESLDAGRLSNEWTIRDRLELTVIFRSNRPLDIRFDRRFLRAGTIGFARRFSLRPILNLGKAFYPLLGLFLGVGVEQIAWLRTAEVHACSDRLASILLSF